MTDIGKQPDASASRLQQLGLCCGMLVVGVLAGLVFAHLPARARQPGLIAFWLALLTGSACVYLALQFPPAGSRRIVFIVGLAGMLSAVSLTAEGYRIYYNDLKLLYLGNAFPETLPTEPGAVSALQELTQGLQEERRRVFLQRSTFERFIEQRLENFGYFWQSRARWFLAGEILLAGILAMLMFLLARPAHPARAVSPRPPEEGWPQ